MLRKVGNVYVYQCRINGRKWSRSTGKTIRKEAERELPRLHKLAALQRSRRNESLQLSKAIVQEAVRVEEDVSKQQAKVVLIGLNNFLTFARDVTLDRIDTALLDKYQRRRLTEASQRTVRGELNFVLRLLRFRGFQVARPVPRPGRVTEQRHFTDDELGRFFQSCPARYQTLYRLMLVTGARLAELVPSNRSSHVALLKSEVDLDRRLITIRTAKMKPGSKPRPRILPIPEELVEPLRVQMESIQGPHVFRRYASIRRDFEAILKRAGVPKKDELGRKVTAHSFRHTYATLAGVAIGDNQLLLMKAIGHSDISTTLRYFHPSAPVIRLNIRAEGGVREGCKVVDVEVARSA